MSNEIATTETEKSAPKNMMEVIQHAMASPDFKVDQLPMLLQFQKDLMAEQAKISYNEAMARLQPQIKQVAKTAKGHNSKYAPHEDIDDMVRPLYTAEGFSVDFNTEESAAGKTTFFGTLAHRDGHSRTFKLTLPPDTGGSKNAIQAVISTNSYAKRELTKMMFNIIVCGEDKDGQGTLAKIDAGQVQQIQKLLTETAADTAGFLKYMGVEKVEDIWAINFQQAVVTLNYKKAQKK